MIADRLITGRPTLTIAEATEMGKCSVDDLFYQAELGNLIIFYIAKAFRIGSITEIDSSIDTSSAPESFCRGPTIPALPLRDDKDFDEKLQKIQALLNLRDLVEGDSITYGRGTKFKEVYEEVLDDIQPVSAATFKDYRIDPRMANIELHLQRKLPLTEEVHDLFVLPNPDENVLVKDALDEGRLVVMAADLKRLLGQSPDENLSVLFEHEYWPEELGMAIAAWQHARDNFQPGENPKAIIESWLKKRKLYGKPIGSEALDRIATIANWQKKGGRKKELEGE